MDYFTESERIYSPKTREYFKEVISSYSNGNYRSAVVMLYSVCICDLLFKLEELKDMYNDGRARTILADIEKNKAVSNSKSSWEKELVDKVKSETNLLDTEAYANLSHLYDYRNLSAHPALNGELELISPPKEIVAAYIRTSLDSILLKPSIFVKSVIGLMTDDINEKKGYILQEKGVFEKFLKSKYLDRMPDAMFQKTFRIFWRFAFYSTDNNCADNRNVNVEVMKLMFTLRQAIILKEIKENQGNYEITSDNSINSKIIEFLANIPQIYIILPDHTKVLINKIINGNDMYKLASWFTTDKITHLNQLTDSGNYIFVSNSVFINYFVTSYEDDGLIDRCLEYMSKVIKYATTYQNGGERLEKYIFPYLNKMTWKHFECIFNSIEDCQNIFNNWSLETYCSIIWEYAKPLLPESYDMSKFTKFVIPDEG